MKKISKSLIFVMCAIMMLGSSFSTFATSVDTTNTKREKPTGENKKDTNTIIGKITSIDATNVTIAVATRKQREKKSADTTQNNQTERQAPTLEERFTLTGESKTFNIASADFGRKAPAENAAEGTKGEKMTSADYNVGDYVRITANKDTPTVAKRIRNANQGFDNNKIKNKKGNYQGGYKGSYTGKTKTEKQQ